jgi:DNA modification methylase
VLICGDALEVMRTLADESVQCCVTSPPYWGLRDYGVTGQLGLERTPEEYVAKMVEVFREVWRLLRDDGTFWLNLGDSYATGGGRVGEAPGGGKQGEAWRIRGLMTTPNRMPIPGLKPKDLVGIPWRAAFALQADGWWLRSDIIWSKPNPMPESVTDRPTKAHEYLFLLAKAERYYYDAEAIKEQSVTGDLRRPYGSQGSWDLDGRPAEQRHGGERRSKMPDGWATHKGAHGSFHRNGREAGRSSVIGMGRNRRTVWTIPTQPYPEAHFATFPEALVEPCIAAGSREGDVVLDPLCGSGTVGVVCVRMAREFIGIDLKPEYVEMARRRIGAVAPLFTGTHGGGDGDERGQVQTD